MAADMLRRSFKTQESLARYWAEQAVALCHDIDEESLNEYIQPLEAEVKALGRDRRIIAIGGASCGKSSLLAGVAGCPLLARAPWEHSYVCWRYRCKDGDATCSRFVPLEALEGLELVDTRSCAEAEVADTVRQLLHGADVVLAVIDGRQPEQSPVWPLLAGLPPEQLPTCLLAVTFTDTMAAEAALKLKETMRELSRDKLGAALTPYFVSPTAPQAMDTFVLRVQEALAAPTGLRTAIRRVVERGLELVRKQGRVLNARAAVARTDSGFLAGIEQEIDNFLSHQLTSRQQCTDTYAEAALRALPDTLGKLRWTFGWFLSPVILLRLELMGAGTEKYYYRCLRDEVLEQQEASDGNFIISCGGHWRSVRPRMKQTLECEIGEFPEQALHEELAELRRRFGRDLYEPFARTHLRHRLSLLFNARAGWMHACIVALCCLLIVAGILGFAGFDNLALGALGLAGLVWLGGSAAHLVSAHRLRRKVVQLGQGLEEEMLATLGAYVERLLISRVAAYRRLYTAPRRKVSQHEAMLEPLQQRHKLINMQLSAAAPRV